MTFYSIASAIKLIDAIINNPQESRKDWMLKIFEANGGRMARNYRYQFWQHENHPVLLDNAEKIVQRLHYLHKNPVKAGFVTAPEHWRYSSAADYMGLDKGLLDIIMFE